MTSSGPRHTEPVGAEFLRRFAEDWLAAWNSHDTDQVLDLLDEEIVWEDPVFWHEVIHGHRQLRRYVEKIWQAMPDVTFREIERFDNADHSRGVVLFEQTGHGPATIDPTRTFRSHGCDIFLRFHNGKLAHYLGSYDVVGMLEQLGAIPSRGERTVSAHLLSLIKR